MVKGEKLLFFRVLGVITLLFLANAGLIFYNNESFSHGLTGFSIKEDVQEIYTQMQGYSKILLIAPWIILILLLIRVGFMDRKIIKEAKEIHTFNIKHTANKNKTDLDILYEVLQKNNKIKISTIAKAFKVKEETAMEWCKILESAELAIIDYPALRKPILILLTKKKKINPLTNKKGTKEGAKPLAKEKKKLTWKEKNLKKGLRKGQSPLQKKKAKQDKKLARKKEKQNKENEKKQTKVSKKKAKQDKKSKRKQSKINKKKTKQNEKKLAKESKKKAKQEKKKKPTKKRRKRK